MIGKSFLCVFVLCLFVNGGFSQRLCKQEEKKLYDGGVYATASGIINPGVTTLTFKINCQAVWHVILNACDNDSYPNVVINRKLNEIVIIRTGSAQGMAPYNIRYGCAPY